MSKADSFRKFAACGKAPLSSTTVFYCITLATEEWNVSFVTEE